MALIEHVSAELKNALRARDQTRLDAIRALRGEIVKRQKESAEHEINEQDVLKLVKMLIKQRRDAIEQFQAGGREDLVAKDQAQIAVLEEFLPEEISAAALAALVGQAIADTAAAGMRDMGKVMKQVMAEIAESGRNADGQTVSNLVKERLQTL